MGTCPPFPRTAAWRRLTTFPGPRSALFKLHCSGRQLAEFLMALIGTLKSAILIRVMGLLIAFLAVQDIIDGVGSVIR